MIYFLLNFELLNYGFAITEVSYKRAFSVVANLGGEPVDKTKCRKIERLTVEINMLRKALWIFLRPLMQLITNLLSPEVGEEWLEELKKFNRQEPCWVKPDFGTLQTIKVVGVREVTSGRQFIARAKKLARADGKKNLDARALIFYRKKENWHLLPTSDSGIEVIYFINAKEFVKDRRIPCLCREGQGWRDGYGYISFASDLSFDHRAHAAVS